MNDMPASFNRLNSAEEVKMYKPQIAIIGAGSWLVVAGWLRITGTGTQCPYVECPVINMAGVSDDDAAHALITANVKTWGVVDVDALVKGLVRLGADVVLMK